MFLDNCPKTLDLAGNQRELCFWLFSIYNTLNDLGKGKSEPNVVRISQNFLPLSDIHNIHIIL